jgi:hypothetical protein
MSSCSPDAQIAIAILAGHAQVNSRAFDRGPQPGQSLRFEWDSPFKHERHINLGGSDERKRNSWRIVLFPPQACPEGHIDNGLDGFDIREKFGCPLALNTPLGEMLAVMRVDPQRRGSRSRVRRLSHPATFDCPSQRRPSRTAILSSVSNAPGCAVLRRPSSERRNDIR